MNYLEKLREKYTAQRTIVTNLQQKALDENRDLSDDEMTQVRTAATQGQKYADLITELQADETRAASVAATANAVTPGTGPTSAGAPTDGGSGTGTGTGDGAGSGGDQTRSQQLPGTPGPAGTPGGTGNAQTQDRDPGHYRRGGQHSFFTDLVRSREHQDSDAQTRLVEHNRALSGASAGQGLLPPRWLTEEYASLARQGRRVADAVRRIPLGNDPRPITLPKQSASTDSAMKTQTVENEPTAFPDAFATSTDVVTPRATVGGQKVSRQMIDASDPAVDALIFGDLIAAYNQRVEGLTVATITQAAGTALKTYATESAFTTAVTFANGKIPFAQDALDLAMKVRADRKLPADILIMAVLRYGSVLGMTDASGRPMIVAPGNGPANAIGAGQVQADGNIQGLGIIASDGVTQYPESIVAARSNDTILWEGDQLRFRYEEPDGPETVRLGIWAYTACLTRYAGQSAKRLQVTAA